VGVPLDARIRVEFSESIDSKTIERALWVTPVGVAKPKIDVSGSSVDIGFATPFPESTTLGVLLTTVIKDRRREGRQNAMARPYRWVFSTGSEIWSGRLYGEVEVVEGQTSSRGGQLLVALYSAEGDTVPVPGTVQPVAITQADEAGKYDLRGLPVDAQPRWLMAMVDRDGNREIRGTGEFYSTRPDTIRLYPEIQELRMPIRLVSPQAPGRVRGTLAPAPGDSVAAWVLLFEAESDSTARPKLRAQTHAGGEFLIPKVQPGEYRLEAFCDADSSGRPDPGEIRTALGLLTVLPGETHDLGELAGPNCALGLRE
jgi:hypothetical protein